MSELIAEARVLVTPDTAAFRSLLTAQVTSAASGVVVPVAVVPTVAAGNVGAVVSGLAASQAAAATSTGAVTTALLAENTAVQSLAASSAELNAVRSGGVVLATQQERQLAELAALERANTVEAGRAAAAAKVEAQARREAAAAAAAQARSLGGLTSGAASAGLSLVGLRGATLAATAPFLAGAAGAIAFSKAIGIATSFNSEISVLGAVTGATAQEMERASEAAKQFGRDVSLPGVSAGDAAKTITEFSKAGLSLNDSIAATRGGLQLAQAAQLDYSDAVQLSANALNAFNLQGDQAVHVADVLANASNLAQGSIGDMALALQQSAGAAQVVGVSFEDTVALLTQLAQNGLVGSDAGTALRTSLLRLVNPSKEANKIIKDLNLNLRDINGNVRPEIFQEFIAAQQGLTKAQQDANTAIVFGVDAFRAIGLLGQELPGSLDRVRAGLDQTGTAAKVAQARMVGLKGATANLQNQLETLGLEAGEVADGPLAALVDQVADFAGVAVEAIAKAKELGGALKGAVPEEDETGGGFFDFLKFDAPLDQGPSFFSQFLALRKAILDGADEVEVEAKKSGIEIRDAVESAGREASRGVAQGFAAEVVGAFQQGFEEINTAIRAGAAATRKAVSAAISASSGQAAGLDEQFDVIIAGGGSLAQQRANLVRQAAVQAEIIRKAGPDAQGKILEARREAQDKLAGINQQIAAIDAQTAAAQKAAADESARVAKEAADERSRVFLERQGGARAGAERRVQLAEETESLQDDIRSRQRLRTLLTQQIKAIRNSALDEKTKQAAIKALVQAKQATSDEINSLVRAQAQQNKEQREAAQEEREAANIALGESVLDLTGNKNPLLRALDAAIKDAVRTRNAAKKGSIAFINAQTEINNLLKRRKDILEDVEDEKDGGPTLVDLFNRAKDIVSGAGNVGFDTAGLQGLSARPRIQMEVQQRLDIVNDPAKAREARQQQSTDRLIAAIDQLTNAITGNSPAGTVTQGPRNRNAWRSLTEEQRFYYQRQAKQMVEQGLTG